MPKSYASALAFIALPVLPGHALAQLAGDSVAAAPVGLPAGDSVIVKTRLTGWNGPGERGRIRAEAEAPLRLRKPTSVGYLSSIFGVRSDPMNRITRAHRGLDIAAPLGTPVFASEDGRVSFAGVASDYGFMIQIDHRDGVQTRYGHLSRILVRTGELITRGETIGLVGSTGRSTGNHLHFEVRIDGRAVDPSRPLPGVTYDTSSPVEYILPVSVHWQGWKETPGRLPTSF